MKTNNAKRPQNLLVSAGRQSLTIMIGLCWLCACGVKGPPEPPEPLAPEPPKNIKVRVREGCVELAWKAPKPATIETPPAARWEVLRADQTEPDELPAWELLARVEELTHLDCAIAPDAKVIYALRAVSPDGTRGKISHTTKIHNLDPPYARLHPQANPGDRFVELSWEQPPDFPKDAGWNIYRAKSPALFPWLPVNAEPVKKGHFVDGPLQNNELYYYEIRAVRLLNGLPAVEGPASPVVSAVPCDRVPPSPPQGFTAIWTEEGVALAWLSNPEPDLDGYKIYRRRKGLGEFKALFLEPIKDTRYLDKTARRGVEYEYVVCAVDNAQPPNQSAPSSIQSVYAEPTW